MHKWTRCESQQHTAVPVLHYIKTCNVHHCITQTLLTVKLFVKIDFFKKVLYKIFSTNGHITPEHSHRKTNLSNCTPQILLVSSLPATSWLCSEWKASRDSPWTELTSHEELLSDSPSLLQSAGALTSTRRTFMALCKGFCVESRAGGPERLRERLWGNC